MKKGFLIFAYILAVLTISACAQKIIVNDCRQVVGDDALFVCVRKLIP